MSLFTSLTSTPVIFSESPSKWVQSYETPQIVDSSCPSAATEDKLDTDISIEIAITRPLLFMEPDRGAILEF